MGGLGRWRPLTHVVRNIDRDAVLPWRGRAQILSPNALRTLIAYSLFAGSGDECWAGERALASALVCSVSTIERGKAELVRLGLVRLVPVSRCPRAAKAGVHHRTQVAWLNRRAIEALPSRVIPSGDEGNPLSRPGVSPLEGAATPYVEGDQKKEGEEGGEKADHPCSEIDLESAWAVADAVARELERPAPSRGDKSERSLFKLRADAVAASMPHWQAALRARLRAFYEQSDSWLTKNRWPLGSALQVEPPQLRVQTYGGEVVAGKRGRARIVRIGAEIVAREFIEDAQEPPASAEEVTACAARITSLLGSGRQSAAPEK